MAYNRKLWIEIVGCLFIVFLAVVLFWSAMTPDNGKDTAVVEEEMQVTSKQVPASSERPTLPPEFANRPEFRDNDPDYLESLGVSVAYVKEHGITDEQLAKLSMADAHDLVYAGVFYEQVG